MIYFLICFGVGVDVVVQMGYGLVLIIIGGCRELVWFDFLFEMIEGYEYVVDGVGVFVL